MKLITGVVISKNLVLIYWVLSLRNSLRFWYIRDIRDYENFNLSLDSADLNLIKILATSWTQVLHARIFSLGCKFPQVFVFDGSVITANSPNSVRRGTFVIPSTTDHLSYMWSQQNRFGHAENATPNLSDIEENTIDAEQHVTNPRN